MSSGSLQSSVLLLLPHITYARLVSTRQVTCMGRLEGVNPSAGLLLEEWPLSQSSQPWQWQQPRFEPRLENPLHKTTHLQAKSAVGHSRACWLLPRLGWLAGGTLWEEREHPQAPGSSQTFQLQAQFLHIRSCVRGAVPGPRISWVRAGLYCCFVLLSVTTVATFIQKCPPKTQQGRLTLAGGGLRWLIPARATSTIPRNCWAAGGPCTKELFLLQLLA